MENTELPQGQEKKETKENINLKQSQGSDKTETNVANLEISPITPPAGFLTHAYMTRLGKILSNLSILCCVFALMSFISIIVWGCWVLVWICLMIGSLGSIFLIIPNYLDLINSTFVYGMMGFFVDALPYVIPIGLVSAIASLILLVWNRKDIPWFRIVFSVIVIILLLLIIKLL